MILLHRLRTQNFKQLTNLDLCFPKRGTVLIEGLNEAGKSSLFEAVFFALYGRPLNRDQEYKIASLKSYNTEEMRVELEFSIDGRPFTISRSVKANQKASLTCPPVEGREGQGETFTGNRPVEQRLQEELSLSQEALLNTCFVEQKGLERLESLQADQRRATVNELLNLRILSQLDEEYRITREDQGAVSAQRRRVEIATLDTAFPALQAAETTAARCLIYSQILEIEGHLRHLRENQEQAQRRQTTIDAQRQEIAALLQRVERIKARQRAIEGDLAHRIRAWDSAIGLHTTAAAEVRKLEELEAGLPGREAQLCAWEGLGHQLLELERLEALLLRQQAGLREAEALLAHFDQLQAQWNAAEVEGQSLQAALLEAATEMAETDAAFRDRTRRNQRFERLALLLRHTAACDTAAREAIDLTRQLEAAQVAAGGLQEHRRRLAELVQLEEQLRRRDEELRELRRVESDLATAEQERDAARERQARIAELQAELVHLEAEFAAAEVEERLALLALRQAEARVALTEWADAAERFAEGDPRTGRLASLQTQQAEAQTCLETAGNAIQAASRTRNLGIGVATVGLLVGLVGIALQQMVILGGVGLLLVLAGLGWALAVGKQLGAARAAEAQAQKTCDGLEGERRAVEREAQLATAEHERRREREAECRERLQKLSVQLPATPTEARRVVADFPSVPVAGARQTCEAASRRVGSARNEVELARRSLEAERNRPGSEPEEMEAHLRELRQEHARLQQASQQAAELPGILKASGVPDASELRGMLQTTRDLVAEGNSAAQSLPDLKRRRSEKEAAAATELEEARKLAAEVEVSGTDPSDWAAIAEAARAEHQQQVITVPDAILLRRHEEARQASIHLQQQLIRLETAQEGRRAELDRQPRAVLIQVLSVQQAEQSATADALASLGEVRPALEAAGLPVDSPQLRTRLALVESDLKRDQEQVGTLAKTRAALQQRGAEAEARAGELSAAWLAALEEEVPNSVEAALLGLSEATAACQQGLAALDEPSLRSQESALQEERAVLERRQAAWLHEREQHLREKVLLLAELGEEPGARVEELHERWAELRAVNERDRAGWRVERVRCQEAVRANRADRRAKAELMNLGEAALDLTAEREAFATLEQSLAVKRRAGEIVSRTRQSIVNRVMPLTMQNMRQILPLLTEGHYQDAEWDEQNNVISVYDLRAGTFQRKRVFSGGARDQISLSLRLAFALATLPGERNIRPGWLFLDEPLSSFDHSRTQALVDLLTRGLLRRQFAQIFLISHSQSFDPGRFDYRVRMDGGQVVSTNLPSLPRE